MQEYLISRELLDYVLDVTQWKTKAAWGEDPMKAVATKVKSALTRTFNQVRGVRARRCLGRGEEGRGVVVHVGRCVCLGGGGAHCV
jgi:hypothetical protein